MEMLLFDLDNTLYSPERELFTLMDERINRYMNEVVGIPLPDVDALRRSYWQRYGVTMQGLMRHHAVDPEDYLTYVHDIDISSRLQPDPELREALSAVPLRKVIFTNSSRDHSERVLQALGIAGQFEEIYDIRVANYLPKPSPEPYHAVLERINLPAARCIMVEDSANNLLTAKALGMGTVLVGALPGPPHVDVQIPTAGEISAALSHWNS
ncbi:MAG: pyrimidine 5'-nucleotidase [Deltaproteobacteria bacterium]|nr:pyrimidine 5'-nucleotidase [Deltaproteobacteria bacterium]TLN02125.1 MAG: pyrimidine 5'-nucleotidase [bacterium]